MKKLLLTLTVLAALLTPSFAVAGGASAVDLFPSDSGYGCGTGHHSTDTPDVCGSSNSQTQTGQNPIIRIIKLAIQILSWVVGVASVILIIISSIQFITSGGNSDKAAGARRTIIYALIGIAVTVLAQVLVEFVLNKV